VNGLLQDEYGVRPEEIQWYEQADRTGLPLALPEHFPLSRLALGQTTDEMLERGELDGCIGPRTPRCYRDGKTPLARLFEDFEPVEKDYYRRTGIYPIMHVVGIRRDVHAGHPWLAERLYAAFEQAKRVAQAELFETAALKVTLPWLLSASREAQTVFGHDFWPYGVERNRVTLEAAIRYAVEQGIARRRVTLEELFAASTLAL
jgi:4,5-dihydroxyphthalate decarboxylase